MVWVLCCGYCVVVWVLCCGVAIVWWCGYSVVVWILYCGVRIVYCLLNLLFCVTWRSQHPQHQETARKAYLCCQARGTIEN